MAPTTPLAAPATPISPSHVALIKAAFRQADVNRSGVISKREFLGLMQRLDKRKWTDSAISALMQVVDQNGDERIQYEEFLDWCMGGTNEVHELLSLARLALCETVSEETRQEALAFLCHRGRSALFPEMSEAIRSDEELCLILMGSWDVPLKYGSESIRNNKSVLTSLLDKNCRNFKYASEELRDDEEVVLQAINSYLRYPWCIEDIFDHVTAKTTGNFEIMQAAVKIQPLALKYAAPELQAEKELVWTAVSSSKCSKYSDALGKDFSEWFPREHFAGDKDIMFLLVKKMPLLLGKASPELRNDKALVLAAVERDGDALEYASDELRADRDIVSSALRHSRPGRQLLQLAAEEFRDDEELLELERTTMEESFESPPAVGLLNTPLAQTGTLGRTANLLAALDEFETPTSP